MVSHEACVFRLAQELRCSCIYVNCITPSVAYNPTSPLTPTRLAVLLVNGNFFLSFLLLPNPFTLQSLAFCFRSHFRRKLKDVLLRRWEGRGVGGRRREKLSGSWVLFFFFSGSPTVQPYRTALIIMSCLFAIALILAIFGFVLCCCARKSHQANLKSNILEETESL